MQTNATTNYVNAYERLTTNARAADPIRDSASLFYNSFTPRTWNTLVREAQESSDETVNNLRADIAELRNRVAVLEDLCATFQKLLDLKSDKDLMKFLEEFGL